MLALFYFAWICPVLPCMVWFSLLCHGLALHCLALYVLLYLLTVCYGKNILNCLNHFVWFLYLARKTYLHENTNMWKEGYHSWIRFSFVATGGVWGCRTTVHFYETTVTTLVKYVRVQLLSSAIYAYITWQIKLSWILCWVVAWITSHHIF